MVILRLRHPATAVLGLVLVVIVAVPACAASHGRLPVVGVQFHGIWTEYTDAERVAVLDALVAAGVQRVRIDASWTQLQPETPDSFDPAGVARLDGALQLAFDRGLRPLVTLWLTPPWANGDRGERALPDDPADYARAAAWAAGRWAGRVDWEIWNEPNSEDFLRGADPVAYAELLKAAYPAIKQADPTATVVSGGVQYNDVEWLEAMYEAGAGGSFDALATHPYQGMSDLPPEAPDDGTKYRLAHLAAVRQLMVDKGDGDRSIWLTELGWSTHGGDSPPWERGVTLDEQADYLVRTLRLVAREMPYVAAVFIYRERDGSDANPHERGYGILTHDLAPKPAWAALRRVLSGF